VAAAARVLYVVARDRPELYTSLRNTFVESPRLTIVMDRRGEGAGLVGGERGGDDERRRLAVDESLRTRGWARIRIEPDGRVIVAESG